MPSRDQVYEFVIFALMCNLVEMLMSNTEINEKCTKHNERRDIKTNVKNEVILAVNFILKAIKTNKNVKPSEYTPHSYELPLILLHN